jgi:hypothetical protein
MQNIFTCIQISNFKAKQAGKVRERGGGALNKGWHGETKSRNIENSGCLIKKTKKQTRFYKTVAKEYRQTLIFDGLRIQKETMSV